MFAVTTAEFTAEGTANILVNRFIPLWGCPSTLLSDNSLHFCARLATAVSKLLGIHKLTTSAYHSSGNGGVERVNHTMAQMLALVCNEHQNDWDVHLPHVEYAYNNSVSAATDLASNEVHIGRLPRLPLTVFDRSYGGLHQNLDRDQLAYCDLARERQQRAYELVREQHALADARVNGRSSTLSDALLRHPQHAAGGWVWVYNTAATIRQGMRKGADNKILKEKLSLNWTGPFKIIAVCLLYLDLPSNLWGPAAKPRVTEHVANLVLTRTMPTTYLDISLPALRNMSYTPLRPSRPVTTSPRTTSPIPRFESMSPKPQVTIVFAVEAVQSLSYMRRTGMASSAPHGNVNWISKPSDTSFLPIGRMVRNTANPILGNTNSYVLTQPRARSPTPKANATSRVLTG